MATFIFSYFFFYHNILFNWLIYYLNDEEGVCNFRKSPSEWSLGQRGINNLIVYLTIFYKKKKNVYYHANRIIFIYFILKRNKYFVYFFFLIYRTIMMFWLWVQFYFIIDSWFNMELNNRIDIMENNFVW